MILMQRTSESLIVEEFRGQLDEFRGSKVSDFDAAHERDGLRMTAGWLDRTIYGSILPPF